MSDELKTDSEVAASDEQTPNDLLENLRELGTALPVSSQPNAHDSGPLLAGVIWYLATGSLVPPKVETPNQAEVNADLAEQTRYNEAEAKVAELERKLAAQDAGPSPVAPAPIAAVEPTPTAPVEQPPAAAVETGAATTPPAPPTPVEQSPAAPAALPTEPTPPLSEQPAPVDPPEARPVTTPPEGTVGS